jgi:phosphomannomutase
MHGVGGELSVRVLEAAGHHVFPVAEQHVPDPDFPTAAFPNPEEPGTLDLAFALADDVDAELILANDPDADRLAVALRRDDGWARLTGDEIGILLGDYLLGRTSGPRAVVTTIVSSSLLAKMAEAHGVEAFTVLTGFKWLAHAAAEHPELDFVLGYEEALGYSVDLSIRDKDGISAALVVAEMAAELAADDKTLDDALDEVYADYGVHISGQVSKWFEGDDAMQRMTELMGRLRHDRLGAVGDAAVVATRDLIDGDGLPPSDVLIYSLDGGRLIIRPSGTEPKVKAYVEAVAPTRAEAAERLDALRSAATELLDA